MFIKISLFLLLLISLLLRSETGYWKGLLLWMKYQLISTAIYHSPDSTTSFEKSSDLRGDDFSLSRERKARRREWFAARGYRERSPASRSWRLRWRCLLDDAAFDWGAVDVVLNCVVDENRGSVGEERSSVDDHKCHARCGGVVVSL
ncbi:hypothetical protein EAF00_002663 [Botryotinia globosa]|nr:hypothetical protein EAF00_002663 [Botryotinia globosa]